MKILLFEPYYRGHNMYYLAHIISAFLEKGYDIFLATTPQALDSIEYSEYLERHRDSFRVLTVSDTIDSLINKYDLLSIIRFQIKCSFALQKVAFEIQPDIVFIPYLDTLFYIYPVLRLLRVVKLNRNAAIQGIYFRGDFGYPDLPFSIIRVIKYLYSSSILRMGIYYRVLFLDEIVYDFFIKKKGKHFRSIIAHCPDPYGDKIPFDKHAARMELQLPCEGKIVGTIGAMEKRKGIGLLIQAFVSRKGAPDEYLFLGGRCDASIQGILENHAGKSKNLIVLNRFLTEKEMLLAIAAMDVIAVVSPKQIGSSSNLIRAATYHKPVLASSFGWIGYATNRYKIGYCCDIENTEELIKGLDWSFNNPSINKDGAGTLAAKNSLSSFYATVSNLFLHPTE